MAKIAAWRQQSFTVVMAVGLGIVLILGVVLLGIGLARGQQPFAQPQVRLAAPTLETVSLSSDWAVTYQDIKSLKQAADVVVVGTITGVGGVTSTKPGLVFTDFTFQVRNVLQDPRGRVSGPTLSIHQTGGVIGNRRYEIQDDPLFQQGEQAILFLHEYSPGHYFVIGGPTGRFRVQGGLVHPVDDEGVQFAASMSEAAFVDLIRKP